MKKKNYVAPRTEQKEVELENGFMSSASIFENPEIKDGGVEIEGHEVGNTGDYSGETWDTASTRFGGDSFGG